MVNGVGAWIRKGFWAGEVPSILLPPFFFARVRHSCASYSGASDAHHGPPLPPPTASAPRFITSLFFACTRGPVLGVG